MEKRKIPSGFISINEREKYKIERPIYCGKTTVQAAAETDFPTKRNPPKKAIPQMSKREKELEIVWLYTDEQLSIKKICAVLGSGFYPCQISQILRKYNVKTRRKTQTAKIKEVN